MSLFTKVLVFSLIALSVKGGDPSPAVNCSQEIAWLFQNITDLNVTPYLASSEFLTSGHFLNNLGDYDSCQQNPGSKYSLLHLYMPGATIFLTGICAVKECDATELNKVIMKIKNEIYKKWENLEIFKKKN